MFACLHGQGNLTALAFEFSPTVERTAADTVAFDVSGLERLFGSAQDIAQAIARRAGETGAKASLALAMNPEAAICAARGFAGVSVVPEGDEAKFLGSLPLEVIAGRASPAPTELLETLERWGIRCLRELAALPPLGIAERLGPEGLRLRELARGEAERQLLPLAEPLRFEEEIEPDYPLEVLEPLLFLLARLLNGLATRLATRGLATDELRLRLRLENRAAHERVLRLPVPSRDAKAFLKLLELDLDGHPPPQPVVHVRLEMNPVKPQAAQGGLYVPAAPEPVKLELTMARIGAMVGRERVGYVALLDTHRRDAFGGAGQPAGRPRGAGFTPASPGSTAAFRRFRPARAAQVALASGQPGFVAAEGIRGRVLEYAGPWRTSGDWWTAGAWQRDEWDIALSDGALYRLYCSPAGWFVEGSYD
jgi:protein ImuB